MKCGPCLVGKHLSCAQIDADFPICECTHDTTSDTPARPVGTIGAALNLGEDEPETTTRTRRLKNDDAVTDQQSTGRKRAAKAFPLKDAEGNRIPCDYANMPAPTLPNYMEVQIDGCGVRPGTLPSHAQSRHHHDYNTLNNERANVALLCHSCHNLLHARNDPYKDVIYERIYGFKPATSDLKHANKALRSGVVAGGKIEDQDGNIE
jgi:hypothetical protein